MRILLLVAALALAGCADRPLNACPYPVAYDADTLNQAALELDLLPPGSTLGGMLVDYGQERAKLRACHK